jgi:hypothetical protein
LTPINAQLSGLSPEQLIASTGQLSEWLNGLRTLEAYQVDLPLSISQFANQAQLGDDLRDLLLNRLGERELAATSSPMQLADLSDDLRFILEFDSREILVTLPSSVTTDNQSLLDLTADLQAAISDGLQELEEAHFTRCSSGRVASGGSACSSNSAAGFSVAGYQEFA